MTTVVTQGVKRKPARAPSSAALAALADRIEMVSRATSATLWDWDVRTGRRWWSEGLERDFGWTAEAAVSTQDAWQRWVHPHDRTAVMAGLHAAMDCHEPVWTAEYRMMKADGTYAHVLDRGCISYNRKNVPVRVAGSISNISQQKLAEEAVRQLTRRLINAQEVERARVARDLHDGVNQIISSGRFRVQMARTAATQSDDPAPHLDLALELLTKALRELRNISHNLRPSELDDLGLLAAVRTLCADFRQRAAVDLELKCAHFPEVLPPETELALYRIIQEALFNVEKHARATKACLHLVRANSQFIVSLHDDGCGFDLRQCELEPGARGLGLVNIRERAAQAGGTAEIRTRPGAGTEILVRIPAVLRSHAPGS